MSLATRSTLLVLLNSAVFGVAEPAIGAKYDGRFALSIVDRDGEPLAARLVLRDGRGRAVRIRPKGAVVVGDSIYFDGETTLELRRGEYSFVVEAGPEFETRMGRFTIDRNSEGSQQLELGGGAKMGRAGWWAGDLHVEMPLATVPMAMKARGVAFAPVAAAINRDGNCRKLKTSSASGNAPAEGLVFGPWACLDDRLGGGVLMVGDELPDVCQWKEGESSMAAVAAAREAGAFVTAISPLEWDLPVWIASRRLDAVSVIHRGVGQGVPAATSHGHRPIDASRFPGKLGPGRASEAVYHHMLNCGLRIPPAAGSGAGMTGGAASNPLGLGRVYVKCGAACDRENWLQGLRAGQSMFTNGPLLRVSVQGKPPGAVFSFERGETQEVQIALDLSFYVEHPVEYLEIVKDGRPIHQVRLDEFADQKGRLPSVTFEDSGWLLVRAVTSNTDFYQYASTAPYFFECHYEPRISRASVEFFLEWLDDAERHFAGREAALSQIRSARPFWEGLRARATAE